MKKYAVSVILLAWVFCRTNEWRQMKTTVGVKAEPAQFDDFPGYPLPLAAHWNLGEAPGGFGPQYQLGLLERGRQILPWLLLPDWRVLPADTRWVEYYEPLLKKAARLRLPFALISTQWEIWLSVEDRFLQLPAKENPNVVTLEGKVLAQVSPIGGVSAWRELGRRWTDNDMMRQLQEWYPDPPYVLFISNNEHAKLPWNKLEEDRRYVERYGLGRDDDFKRQLASEGWIERYRALQDGMRQGLANEAWRNGATFVGYNAFGPAHFARWAGWTEFSLYQKGRIDPAALAWDGGSAPFYVFNWSAATDHTVFSPQIEAMNWVFMQSETRRSNPGVWFEMSVWDGHEPGAANDKIQNYLAQGQNYSPERYRGMAQFGMWLLRPRVIREFRPWLAKVSDFEPYFIELLQAVERVHTQPVLRDFWQRGRLVANPNERHPYQILVPVEYRNAERWFLLDTSLSPKRPWELGTKIPVFALAVMLGKAPQRQWLIYAQAPLGVQSQVTINLPGYRPVKMDVEVGGMFYLVDEKWQRVTPLS